MKRGELWWADLGRPRGSAPALRRPVLIIGADPYNRSQLHTVIVVVLTSNVALAALPGKTRCRLRPPASTSTRSSTGTQIATVDRGAFEEHAGALPDWLMAQVNAGLSRALALAPLAAGPPMHSIRGRFRPVPGRCCLNSAYRPRRSRRVNPTSAKLAVPTLDCARRKRTFSFLRRNPSDTPESLTPGSALPLPQPVQTISRPRSGRAYPVNDDDSNPEGTNEPDALSLGGC